ncbi:MAG: transposase, partial [Bryocella sp.]
LKVVLFADSRGITTQQRGLRRFTLRGQATVDAQWKLFCIVHNVAKLQLDGKMAAQAGKYPQKTPHTARITAENQPVSDRRLAVDIHSHRRNENPPARRIS